MLLMDVSVRLLWHAQAQFAGYHVAEHERLGENRGLNIVTSPVDFARGPIEALFAGDVDFAVASPSHLIESGRAAELLMVLSIQQQSALAYPARRERGIAHPRDLVGKRVGVWPGREHLELDWMLVRAGVDPALVEHCPMNDTVAPFLAGEVDCAQMTVYHELSRAIDCLGGTDEVTLFRAVDWGASLVKDGLVTLRRTAQASPTLVQDVVETLLEGWRIAFDAPDRAISACLAADPSLDPAHQRQQLAIIRELAEPRARIGDGLGCPDIAHLEHAARALAELGNPVRAGVLDGAIDQTFWVQAQSRVMQRHGDT
jgi:ABC-type nitrate/sulfonate/bicarbonate transport system substrate-binding protein